MTIITVKTGGIAADAVTDAKIADDLINSEHYTDGSIDTAHLADGQVTTAKLATAVFTGATDIGAAIVDADLFLMDDGAGGTIRKTAASRLKTYAGGLAGVSTSSGNVTITDGNLTFGGAGHGVHLGVTSATAANLLDDYEEGTWTPVIRNHAYVNGTIMAIDGVTANYTKIGDTVNIRMQIRRNDTQSLTSTLFLTALPFTTGAASDITGVFSIVNNSGSSNGIVESYAGITIAKFRSGAAPQDHVSTDDIVNRYYLNISMKYKVA